ncbi:MAG: PQQ-binding-like beta-propeller repeat protein, partial [Armatimonadota bacterium]
FFAGRGRANVVAVSAADGSLLWSIPGGYNATNLLFTRGHLFAHIPGAMMIEPASGRIVKDLGTSKRSCARFTGCPEALFHRGSIRNGEGTTRYDLQSGTASVIHAFRPPCNDGVIPADGLLHVTQWDCDCNLQLMGGIALAPGGDFEFNRDARESERLQVMAHDPSDIALFMASGRDWNTYRMDNERSSCTPTNVPEDAAIRWQYRPNAPLRPSPPTAAGGLVFVGGSDCKIRAIDANTGALRWCARLGGPSRLPPSIWKGRAFVGCNDGYVYALEAATGRLLWRFRAAPVERRIMVFDQMWSTWPVNSGVLVHEGIAYAAAGIINYDGTHVYALDAVNGKIRWQNNTSGHLNRELREGVSVQGDMAVFNDILWLAGGNVTSPARYDLATGKCLNSPPDAGWPRGPRGSEVFAFMSKYLIVGGRRLFAQDDDPIVNWSGFQVQAVRGAKPKHIPGRVPPAFGNGVVAMSGRGRLVCVDAGEMEQWLQQPDPKAKLQARWTAESLHGSVSVAIAGKAVVAAGQARDATGRPAGWAVEAFGIEDGGRLWSEPLPSAPLPGGLCVDRDGQAIVVLEDGGIVCVGKA